MYDTPFTRRQFLNTSLALVSTCGTVPRFLAHASTAVANPSDPDQHRILVVIQLSGGNDGLNTVVPIGDPAYHNARRGLALPEDNLITLDTDTGIALHPSMRGFADLLFEGQASIVQGVGYPNPNRSHFASMDVWHTGDTLAGNRGGRETTGWIGRAMDHACAHHGQDPNLAVVSIGSEAPLATRGQNVNPVAFQDPNLFRWMGNNIHPALAEAYAGLHEGETPSTDAAAFVHRTALDAQLASDQLRDAVRIDTDNEFPRGNRLAQQLKLIAQMIKADLPTTVYYAALGGFDTHSGQLGTHNRLLSNFSQAVSAFQRELADSGHDQRVTTLAFSEFGRRVSQNASQGTDHGAAGPVFVLGPSITPGLIGEHPSLTNLDQGDLIHHTDFRSVYASLLGDWLQLDAAPILGGQFASAPLIQTYA